MKTLDQPQSETFYRVASIENARAGDDPDDRRVELAFSSEQPYTRHFGDEVLEHSLDALDDMDRYVNPTILVDAWTAILEAPRLASVGKP